MASSLHAQATPPGAKWGHGAPMAVAEFQPMGKTMHKALRVKIPVAHGWPKSMESHTMGQGTL